MVDQNELLDQLKKKNESQFEELLLRLKVDKSHIRWSGVTLSQKVVDLIEYLAQQEDGLQRLQERLELDEFGRSAIDQEGIPESLTPVIISHVGDIYILKHDSAAGNRVTLASPENQHFPQPRPLPVRLPPRRFPLLLGRREDVTVAVNTLPYNQPMEFYGSAGIGKTALLRYLAHHPEIAPAFSDGIVYHRLVRHQTVSDLLQVLFNAFYECPTPFKATDMQIRDALNKKALILLDGATLTREEVDGLLNDLPSCTLLFASLERQLWGEGRAVELGGLPPNEAVALVAQELGHPLSPEERSDAEKLCIALEGHPLRILQAVAIAREEKHSLAAIVQRVQSPATTGTWTKDILLSLTEPQKLILTLFAALGVNIALKAEHIAKITELPDLKPALEALLRRNLIQANDERYNLTSNLIEELQQEKWNLTHWMERTTSFFTKWVQQHCGTPEQLLQEQDIILQVLEEAVGAGHWSIVLHLGRTVEGILALSGQWGDWDLVLKWMLLAARAMGDRAAEAFVLHQLGTRSFCLSEIANAQSYLTEALEIREVLNDQAGIEVTRHNLNFLVEPPPLPDPPPQPLPEPLPEPRPNPPNQKKRLFILGGGIAVLLLALLLLFLKHPDLFRYPCNIVSSPGEPPPPTPPPTPPTPSPKPSLLTLNLSPTTANWGATVEGTVSLDKPAPEGEIEVTLSSNNPSLAKPVPSKVTVKAGKKTPVFIQIARDEDVAKKYPDGGPVEITASYNGESTPPVTLTVEPKPIPKPPPSPETSELESLTLNPKDVKLGEYVYGELKLKSPAPDNGVTIFLKADNPLVQQLPDSVKFEAGEPEKHFSFLISQDRANNGVAPTVPNTVTVTVTAVYGDSKQSDSVIVTLPPPPQPVPELQSLDLKDLNEYKVVRGDSVKEVNATVVLTLPAPSGGAEIQLDSDNDLATVPSFVRIQPGNISSEPFQIEIQPYRRSDNSPKETTVTLRATYQGGSKDAKLLIVPPPKFTSLVLDPQPAYPGDYVTGTITLSGPVPSSDITVKLHSSNRSLAPVPSEVKVIVRGGRMTAPFSFKIPDKNLGGDVTITASYDGSVSLSKPLKVHPRPG